MLIVMKSSSSVAFFVLFKRNIILKCGPSLDCSMELSDLGIHFMIFGLPKYNSKRHKQ